MKQYKIAIFVLLHRLSGNEGTFHQHIRYSGRGSHCRDPVDARDARCRIRRVNGGTYPTRYRSRGIPRGKQQGE